MSKDIPFGKIEEGKIILESWGDQPDRIIGEIREEDLESSVSYFQDRFKELATKISELEEKIAESENKGSYLMKLVHLQELLTKHDGLGDYQQLKDRLSKQEMALQDIITQNRQRNSEIKRALIQELEEAVAKINWKESTELVHEIKSKWIKTGNPIEEDQEELEQTFWGGIEKFFERKRIFYEDKRKLQEKFKRDYENLVNEASQVGSLYGKMRFDRINDLKQRWRDVGNISKELYDPLLREFNFKLKAKKRHQPQVNLHEIIQELEGITSGQIRVDFRKLEERKKQLREYRPLEPSLRTIRNEALSQIQVLMERDFLDKLAKRRFEDFEKLESEKKKSIRVGILKELISRDKSDLTKFEENSGNFSSRDGQPNSMIERKLSQQRSKIEVKERLLELLNEKK